MVADSSVSVGESPLALSESMKLTMLWYPRVTGAVTFASSMCMISLAWSKRSHLFHRIVLGMSFHGLLYGICYMIGALAIPREEYGYVGYSQNVGTIETCTAQGFIIYVSIRTGVFYYACLSLFSFLGVLNNFDKKKYAACEKWIHAIAHGIPFSFAFYFLAVEGFNPGYSYCRQTSHPLGCSTDENLACERGPDSHGPLEMFWFFLFPMVLTVGVSTGLMVALYYKIKKREQRQLENPQTELVCVMQSGQVRKQSCIYLLVLYWVITPFFVFRMIFIVFPFDDILPVRVFAEINYALFFFWTLLMYRYFTADAVSASQAGSNAGSQEPKPSAHIQSSEFIFNFDDAEEKDAGTASPDRNENGPAPEAGNSNAPETPPSLQRSGSQQQEQFTFNIFDGTNATGTYSGFIYCGDSDDEDADQRETDHWNSVQNLR